MILTSGQQHILIVLFCAHVMLNHYLRHDPHPRGDSALRVPAAMGILTALLFLDLWGLVAALLVFAAYGLIHWLARNGRASTCWHYLGEHAVSIALLIAIVAWVGDAGSGAWLAIFTGPPLQAIAILTGLAFLWWTGSRAVRLLVKDLPKPESGAPEAGALIGRLERSLILFLVLAGAPSGIGLLVAAKSILRFGEVRDADNREMAEYVLIGTLASFAFAIPVAYVTAMLVRWAK